MLLEAVEGLVKGAPVIAGALIAGLISYFGVVAANKSSLARLRVQHENDRQEAALQRAHDAKQKEEDRKAAIRRQVYIDAVEEAHALLAAIGSLTVRPLDFSGVGDVEPLQKFLKANAKVWLVAESEAALLSRELTSQLSELYMKALASAQPSRIKFQEILDVNASLVSAEADVRRIETKISELKEANAELPAQDAASESWKKAQEWISALKASRQQAFDAMMPGRIAHTTQLFEDLHTVQRTLVRVVSSLRREIHLSANEEEFLLQLHDMERRAKAVIERAVGQSI